MSVTFYAMRGKSICSAINEVNFSNVNARGIIDLLGLPDDRLYGRIDALCLPAYIRTGLYTIHNGAPRQKLVQPQRDGFAHEPRIVVDPVTKLPTISQGCRVIEMGNTDQRTVERLWALVHLMTSAIDIGADLAWG